MHAKPENWQELVAFVQTSLCAKENLIPEQFPLQTDLLTRNGKFCGAQFNLFGPRQIRLMAVWTMETNTVFLFDARGVRYESVTFPGILKELPAAA